MAPRRQQMQSDPILEEFSFTPYFNDQTKSISMKNLAEAKAIRTCIDIVIENTSAMKLKVAEIAPTVRQSIALEVHKVGMFQPLNQIDVTLLTHKSEARWTQDLDKVGIKIVTKDSVAKMIPDEGSQLFIVHDPAPVDTLAEIAKPQTFILVVLGSGKQFSNPNVLTVARKFSSDREFLLLRKVCSLLQIKLP